MFVVCGQDAEAVWAFRRHFAAQTGISSLMCHIFTCGERFPQRIVFDRRTARVISWEFRPGYVACFLWVYIKLDFLCVAERATFCMILLFCALFFVFSTSIFCFYEMK